MTDPRKWPLQGELSEFALKLLAAREDLPECAKLTWRQFDKPWTDLDTCVHLYMIALASEKKGWHSAAVEGFQVAAIYARRAGELQVATLIDAERAELKRTMREARRAKQQRTEAETSTRRASAYARRRMA